MTEASTDIKIISFADLEKREKEKQAIDYYVKTVYNNVITCPRCKTSENIYRRKDRPRLCQCTACNYTFSLFKGTIFEKSHTSLIKWFEAQKLLLNDKKGMPSLQLQRHFEIFKDQNVKTNISYKTAWRIFNKTRKAMGNEEIRKNSHTIIEPDETYIGPKPRRGAGRRNKKGRGTSKTPVLGFYDRFRHNVHVKIMPPNKRGRKLSGQQIKDFIDQHHSNNVTLITDEFKAYNIFNNCPENQYKRYSISHSKGQYSDGKGVHTNHIEGFWSTIKRGGLYSRYHRIGSAYLKDYVNEYVFRFSHKEKNCKQLFDAFLKQTVIDKGKACLIKKPLIEEHFFAVGADSVTHEAKHVRYYNNIVANQYAYMN